eukprot:364245-Rhodomonas_salina.1
MLTASSCLRCLQPCDSVFPSDQTWTNPQHVPRQALYQQRPDLGHFIHSWRAPCRACQNIA